MGDTHTFYDERDELSREKCPIKGYNPDLYLCKRDRNGRLVREIIVEAEVTIEDLWKPHTRGQLRIACEYCARASRRRETVLVVPRESETDAANMLKLIRMKNVKVLSF